MSFTRHASTLTPRPAPTTSKGIQPQSRCCSMLLQLETGTLWQVYTFASAMRNSFVTSAAGGNKHDAVERSATRRVAREWCSSGNALHRGEIVWMWLAARALYQKLGNFRKTPFLTCVPSGNLGRARFLPSAPSGNLGRPTTGNLGWRASTCRRCSDVITGACKENRLCQTRARGTCPSRLAKRTQQCRNVHGSK